MSIIHCYYQIAQQPAGGWYFHIFGPILLVRCLGEDWWCQPCAKLCSKRVEQRCYHWCPGKIIAEIWWLDVSSTAHLVSACLASARLASIRLGSARWASARLASARWASARWASARWASARWTSARWTSARWASARWASARWASASLTSAYLTSTYLMSAYLMSTHWTSTHWTSALMTWCLLTWCLPTTAHGYPASYLDIHKAAGTSCWQSGQAATAWISDRVSGHISRVPLLVPGVPGIYCQGAGLYWSVSH